MLRDAISGVPSDDKLVSVMEIKSSSWSGKWNDKWCVVSDRSSVMASFKGGKVR